jgi:hypothetical protein
MAGVKESNRDGGASKKRTTSSNASVVTPSKFTKRSGTFEKTLSFREIFQIAIQLAKRARVLTDLFFQETVLEQGNVYVLENRSPLHFALRELA